MDLQLSDRDRLVFEKERQAVELACTANPRDADNLTKWGSALLKLSSFQGNPEDMMKEAIMKLEQALEVDPERHATLIMLGNAHSQQGFFTPNEQASLGCFIKAVQCFEQAMKLDPGNEMYLMSLGSISKAPKKNVSDLKYDIVGWVILGIGIAAWIGMAKSHPPPPPPPRYM